MHLRTLSRKRNASWPDAFPFWVPTIASLSRLEFSTPAAFFVGENGSGKSTLLEALACAARLPTVGGDDVERDDTLCGPRLLASKLSLSWSRPTHRGFFLRAEDYFNFARRINATARELETLAEGYERDFATNPDEIGAKHAAGYVRGQRQQLRARYGEDADALSHGEGFMNLFAQRLVPNGLYLLDEPEAALSPTRQLAFLSLMKEFAAQNCQFIIATHSPLLLAFPGAQIWSFDGDEIMNAAYDELSHVQLTRAFLSDPEAFLRRL